MASSEYKILISLIENLDKRITKAIQKTDPPRWMTVAEAAAYIGLSKSYFYRKVKNEIRHIKEGTRIIFDRNDLDQYMSDKLKRIPDQLENQVYRSGVTDRK